MNFGRETILAGIAGFALGLGAAWAVWNLPELLPQKNTSTTVEQSPTPSLAEGFSLSINQPEDGSLSDTGEVTVSGKTQAGATVVVNGPSADDVLEASSDGSFKTTVALDEGANEIDITAYASDGTEKSETRTVNYTKEEF